MPEIVPANAYRRLLASRVWQEQRMPAVVLAATGLMAMVGMGSVAVAAVGWSTTSEVSVDGVTMTPSAGAPQVGVAVRTTIGPDGRPVATVVLSTVPGTPTVLTPVPVAPVTATPLVDPSITDPAAPVTPEPVSPPAVVPVSEVASVPVSPVPASPPPVETTGAPVETPVTVPPPVTEATSAPTESPSPTPTPVP
ncbi:hypothetical protein ACIA8K_14340 [Catenuloplanes sp. NPDC051500]|uniref:hypothetical protein n=1 Tax=Catenuloplanes sp. NPDC051500 TaxID=3363959 RepID=UPI0037A3E447